MGAVEVTLNCELAIMGPPEPAELVLRLSVPDERAPAAAMAEEVLLVEVRIDCLGARLHQSHSFGTERARAEGFLGDLEQLARRGEGGAVLSDDDQWNYLRVQSEEHGARSAKVSGRFCSVPVDIESDPEEASFFQGAAVASGFQGLRVRDTELARAAAELTDGLATLV